MSGRPASSLNLDGSFLRLEDRTLVRVVPTDGSYQTVHCLASPGSGCYPSPHTY